MKPIETLPFGDLTKEDVKVVEEFRDIPDELAQQIADAIRTYTEIIYQCYFQERFEEQNARVIQLTTVAKKAA